MFSCKELERIAQCLQGEMESIREFSETERIFMEEQIAEQKNINNEQEKYIADMEVRYQSKLEMVST